MTTEHTPRKRKTIRRVERFNLMVGRALGAALIVATAAGFCGWFWIVSL